jgi:hypothetical protein
MQEEALRMDKIVAIAGHVRALFDDEAFPDHIPGGPFGDHTAAGSCPHYNQIKFVKFHNVSKRSAPEQPHNTQIPRNIRFKALY